MANQQNFLARNKLYLPLIIAAVVIPFSPVPWLTLIGVGMALSWFAVREHVLQANYTVRYRRLFAVLGVLLTAGLLLYSFATIPVVAGVTLQQWLVQILHELWQVFFAIMPALAHALGSAIVFALVKLIGGYIVRRLPQWYAEINAWLNTHVSRSMFVLLLLSLVFFTGVTLAVIASLAWGYLMYKTLMDFNSAAARRINLARVLAVVASVLASLYLTPLIKGVILTLATLGLGMSSLGLTAATVGVIAQMVGIALIAALAVGVVYLSLIVVSNLLQRYLPSVYSAGDRWLIRLANDPLLSVGYHSPLVRALVAVAGLVLVPMLAMTVFSIFVGSRQLYAACKQPAAHTVQLVSWGIGIVAGTVLTSCWQTVLWSSLSMSQIAFFSPVGLVLSGLPLVIAPLVLMCVAAGLTAGLCQLGRQCYVRYGMQMVNTRQAGCWPWLTTATPSSTNSEPWIRLNEVRVPPAEIIAATRETHWLGVLAQTFSPS